MGLRTQRVAALERCFLLLEKADRLVYLGEMIRCPRLEKETDETCEFTLTTASIKRDRYMSSMRVILL